MTDESDVPVIEALAPADESSPIETSAQQSDPVTEPTPAPEIRTRTRVQPVSIPSGKPVDGTLASVMASVAKLHGPNVIRPARQGLSTFTHLSTGVFLLDMALLGGIPESLISVIIGWEGSGKTTTAMRVVGSAQRKYPDRSPVFVDAEGTFQPAWAERHGVDVDRLLLVQPESGEQAVDVIDAVIRASDTSVVVLDSLPALMPMKELEKSAEDAVVALQARLIGNLIRKATQAILDERKKGHRVTLILINQWRNKIVMMGDPRNAPGGNALKFFKSVDIELKNKEIIGRDARNIECVDHNEHSFKITKMKLGNSIREGEFSLIRNPDHPLGVGYIDEEETILAYAKKMDVFTGGGSSWHIDGIETRFNRHIDATRYLYENPDFTVKLRRRLICMQRRACGLNPLGWE